MDSHVDSSMNGISYPSGGLSRESAEKIKAMAEKAIMNNPKLPGGASPKPVTREQFDAMGYKEMVQFKAEHPELYAEYMKTS